MNEGLIGLDGSLSKVYSTLRACFLGLGSDVGEVVLKHYVAYKRQGLTSHARKLVSFAGFEPRAAGLWLYVKVDPDNVSAEPGFTRDVREIGYKPPGNLEEAANETAEGYSFERIAERVAATCDAA